MECESETCVDILNGKIYKGIAYMGEMWGGYPEYGSWIYMLAVECESKCIRRMKIEGEWRILRGLTGGHLNERVMVWEKNLHDAPRDENLKYVYTHILLIYARWNMKSFPSYASCEDFVGIFEMPRSCYH